MALLHASGKEYLSCQPESGGGVARAARKCSSLSSSTSMIRSPACLTNLLLPDGRACLGGGREKDGGKATSLPSSTCRVLYRLRRCAGTCSRPMRSSERLTGAVGERWPGDIMPPSIMTRRTAERRPMPEDVGAMEKGCASTGCSMAVVRAVSAANDRRQADERMSENSRIQRRRFLLEGREGARRGCGT